MERVRAEVKLSKSYNTFCYSAEGSPEEADALRLFVMLKTFEFINEFEQLKDVDRAKRLEAIKNKLEELKFGWWMDKDGWHNRAGVLQKT